MSVLKLISLLLLLVYCIGAYVRAPIEKKSRVTTKFGTEKREGNCSEVKKEKRKNGGKYNEE